MLIANGSNSEFFVLDGVKKFQIFVRLGSHKAYHVTISIEDDDEEILCTCEVGDRSQLQAALQEANRIKYALVNALVKGQDAIIHDSIYRDDRWHDLEYETELENPDRFIPVFFPDDCHELCLSALEDAVVGGDDLRFDDMDEEDGDYGYAEV